MFRIQDRLLTLNRWSRPGTKLKAVKGIIIHWTANESYGADAEANRRFFENRKAGNTGTGSTQFIVDDKEILRCVPEDEVTYQVGAKSYKKEALQKYGSYPNNSVLGIEMCVNSNGDFSVVYEQTVELTAYLMKKHNLTINDIDRHYDITGKNCPGYFTSDHWGYTNNKYAVKFGLGSNADKAWGVFVQDVQDEVNGVHELPKHKVPEHGVYVVQPGDTLGKIADQVDATMDEILEANPSIKNPNLIRVGQEITIPGEAEPKPTKPKLYEKGDAGEKVKDIQDVLNYLGYNAGVVDGRFGPQTDKAVKAFQKDERITIDGIVGPNTFDAFEDAARPRRPSTIKEGSRGKSVEVAQRLLNYHGSNAGTVDGMFGSQTKASVKRFQRSKRIGVDGVVGPQTWTYLQKRKR